MEDFRVDQQSAAIADMAELWSTIDALTGGTLTMRKAGKKLLPQWPSEDDTSYKERVETAVLFNAFNRTTEVLAAKPFARPIEIDGVNATIEGYYDNIDMQGTNLHAWAGQVMLAALRYGLHGVLVDVPEANGIRTKADEKKAGIRPYMTQYPGSSILGWRTAVGPDGYYLTQLRLKEEVIEPKGVWGEEKVEQVRVLTPGAWEIWRKAKADNVQREEWALFKQGATTIDVIPFVFFYGRRCGFGIGRPPLTDLAYMNVEHWQSSSDQQTILHVARVPILFAKGLGANDKVIVGSKSFTKTKDKDASIEYVEHTGAAIEAGRQSILDLEDRMRQVGAELLVERPTVTTATQVTSEDDDSRSIMQKIVEEYEDSLEHCFRLMGLQIGEKLDPEIQLYKDFSSNDLSGKTGDLLMGAVDRKVVSKKTALSHLKRADIVTHDLDEEEELKQLDVEQAQDLKLAEQRTKATKPDQSDKLKAP